MSSRRQFAKSLGLSGAVMAATEGRSLASSFDSAAPNVTRLAKDLQAAVESYPVDDTHCHPVTDHDASTTPEHFLERMALSAMPEASYFPSGILQQWREGTPAIRAELDRRYGIEKKIAGIIKHYRQTIFVKCLTKEMARYLRCKPDLESVIAARNEHGRDYAKYLHGLFLDARLGNVMVDTGFAEGMDANGIGRFERAIAPTKLRALARVDTLQAPLLARDSSFRELEQQFVLAVQEALDRNGNFGYKSWGMKSYLLPRLGLVRPHYDADAAKKSWEEYKTTRSLQSGDREQLADRGRKLQEYLFTLALEECMERDMPMQMHAGDGEAPGVILRRQHPYYLEEVVRFDRDGVMRMPKLIPIHAGYPLVGEAAWLSHLYSNCYFEISLMNPLINQGLVRRFLEIFEVVPLSKVLFGSDAYHLPEFYWLAAKWGKRYLCQALAVYVAEGILTRDEALEGARMVLFQNNRTLYNLPQSGDTTI